MMINFFAWESQFRKWLVIRKVKRDGFALRYVPDHCKDNTDIVRAAVRESGVALTYASDRLKNDRMTVMIACETNGIILMDVSRRLQDDQEVVLTAMRSQGSSVLQFASSRLRSDLDFISTAVRHDWRSLQWASENLRNNTDLLMKVVFKHGSAIRFASDRLKDNWRLAYLAVSNEGHALRHVSVRLRNDLHIVKRAIINNIYAVYHAGDDVKNSTEVVEAVIKEHPSALWTCFGPELRTDPKRVVLALEKAESYARRMPPHACYSVYFDDPKHQWKKPESRPMKLRLKQVLNGDGKVRHDDAIFSQGGPEVINRIWPQYESRIKLCIRSKWERTWLIGQLHKDAAWKGSDDVHQHIHDFVGEDMKSLVECEPLIHTLLRFKLPIYD